METIETKNNENDEEGSFSKLTNHFITLQWLLFGAYLLYVMLSFMGAQEAQRKDLRNIGSESDFNKVALEAYVSCRGKLISGTRDECLVLAKEAVNIRNLEGSFTAVVNGIEAINAKADKGKYHYHEGKYLFIY